VSLSVVIMVFGLRLRTDNNYCSGRSNGLYTVLNNCSAYYRCFYGQTFVRQCRAPL